MMKCEGHLSVCHWGLVVLLLLAVGCPKENPVPHTLDECLLRGIGVETPAGAERICHRVFSFWRTGQGVPADSYFVVTDRGGCEEVRPFGGRMGIFRPSQQCPGGSRFERTVDDELLFSCRQQEGVGPTRVYEVEVDGHTLVLTVAGQETRVFRTLAECEQTIPDALRVGDNGASSAEVKPAPVVAPPELSDLEPEPLMVDTDSVYVKCCACLAGIEKTGNGRECMRGNLDVCPAQLRDGDFSGVNTLCMANQCQTECRDIE